MAIVGYARVSTGDQDTAIQVQQLKEAGCTKVFSENRSGTNMERPEWTACFQYLRDGDTLMVTRLDRLARSMGDLFKIIDGLKEKQVEFRVLHQPEIDTTSPNGRLFLSIIGAIAEFETEVRKARQREGIEAAKARGAYKYDGQREKKRVASLLLGQGLPIGLVHVKTGIPLRTLHSWFPPDSRARVQGRMVASAARPTAPSAAEAVAPEATPETEPRKPGVLGRIFG